MTTAGTDGDRVPTSTLLSSLGRDATARVRLALRPLSLTAQQFLVLEQLRLTGPTSQADLADAVGIDRSNLATIAAGLCDRGLAERSRDPADRRRYLLGLSAAGERLLGRAETAVAAAEEELLAPLDPARRAQLHGLLRRLADGARLCPTEREDG
ncbi:MAG: MarR family transcriptional regulator [Actinobacteria bacterium]|nr:MarR family transcriptional regulator [Actinomycetota bacterium]